MITDNAYKSAEKIQTVKPATSNKIAPGIFIDTSKSYGWYDFSIKIKGNTLFERRYAGRVETGAESKTDPFMGRII